MRDALRLARRGYGLTSPNPMVGAVLVRGGRVIGKGWHHRPGMPHAEIEALHDAAQRGERTRGGTLYVTLEPCSTSGRTPPCTEAIIAAGIRRVVVGATDPNPRHGGKGFEVLRTAGIRMETGVLAEQCAAINAAFNHWIVARTPFVVVKAAMTLDGKISTEKGESKWITGEKARAFGMRLRQGVDAIAVGINTIIADDPELTVRGLRVARRPLRIILDPRARTPLSAKVLHAAPQRGESSQGYDGGTLIVVGEDALAARVGRLRELARVVAIPSHHGKLDLTFLLRMLGKEQIISLLVEGGGEANASFLLAGLANKIYFFYAPKVLGGRFARRSVAGEGVSDLASAPKLEHPRWRRLGPDLLLEAKLSRTSGI
jgi:diaminohydroxyphosphoribosylaminopyrimidine deaminase/5-amino-6-(5-phosphoribosylamino)uracil reductase